ncbi:MAG: Lrp/AsnC family transcriptional regulator [Caldilineales bacterium]|nr:Lrp/AsnC family transcriptional regulator [Caldilineales bacterium]
MVAFLSNGVLDETAIRILEELQADARISLAELGRRVALSAPAVAERVKRLEEAGVIEGYRAVVNPRALGYGLTAIVRLAPQASENTTRREREQAVMRPPEVTDCWHTVGDDCFYLKVVVRDTEHLEQFLQSLLRIGKTSTSIVMSTAAEGRPIRPAHRSHE